MSGVAGRFRCAVAGVHRGSVRLDRFSVDSDGEGAEPDAFWRDAGYGTVLKVITDAGQHGRDQLRLFVGCQVVRGAEHHHGW